MALENLELLEKRVQEMIELLRVTKEEKHLLEIKLAEQADALRQVEQERGEVKQRVEKILGTLSRFDGNTNNVTLEEGVQKESGQETPY